MNLEVILLTSERQFAAAPGNRGREWAQLSPVGYSMRHVPTWRLSRGEWHGDATFYTTKPFALRLPRATKAVVLGGWESPSYLQALLAAKRRGAATVGFYESTMLTQSHLDGPVAAVRRFYFSKLDAVVVPGEAAEEAVKSMNLPSLRIFRGFNAVAVDKIHAAAAASRQATMGMANGSTRGHRYLFLGRLIPSKNIESALRAFATMSEPGDTFTVTGTGELRDRLKALAIPGVEFTDPVPYAALPELLARHDTLVLPSTGEVWGLVVNEALAAGLHVVVSDRCGVAPSVRAMAGVTVTPTTIDGIAHGLFESRAAWKGPIQMPEILSHGPAEFAGTFIEAISYATSTRTAKRRSRG